MKLEVKNHHTSKPILQVTYIVPRAIKDSWLDQLEYGDKSDHIEVLFSFKMKL